MRHKCTFSIAHIPISDHYFYLWKIKVMASVLPTETWNTRQRQSVAGCSDTKQAESQQAQAVWAIKKPSLSPPIINDKRVTSMGFSLHTKTAAAYSVYPVIHLSQQERKFGKLRTAESLSNCRKLRWWCWWWWEVVYDILTDLPPHPST